TRRMGRRLDVRRLARRVGGGAPNLQTGLRSRPEGLDSAAVRGVLELGLRIGESMLALGASAVDVTQAIRTVIRAFGLYGTQIDLTFTAITVSYDRGCDELPVTMMRIVRDRIPDYGRPQRVVELAQDVAD